MSTQIYVNHRENQKDLILEIAENLFIQHGIEQITIGKIAKEARLTRATLYNYFANKEEIAKEIYRIITRGWVERNEREVWQFSGSGYEQLERFAQVQFEHLLDNPRQARFIAEFNSLYAKAWSVEETLQLIDETLGDERQKVFEAIQQGQKDGSLRADMEPELMIATFFNFMSGMISRMGEMGIKVEGEYGLSLHKIFTQIYRIFLDGLKA